MASKIAFERNNDNTKAQLKELIEQIKKIESKIIDRTQNVLDDGVFLLNNKNLGFLISFKNHNQLRKFSIRGFPGKMDGVFLKNEIISGMIIFWAKDYRKDFKGT